MAFSHDSSKAVENAQPALHLLVWFTQTRT